MQPMLRLSICAVLALATAQVCAHDETRLAAEARRREVERLALAQADTQATQLPAEQTARVTLKIIDEATGASLPGLVRITNADDGKAIRPEGEIHRAANWFSLAADTMLTLPRRSLKFVAVQGLETEQAERTFDLTNSAEATIELKLRRFFDARAKNLRAGNTHLHLRDLSFAEMDRYLRLVPQTDGLDVVFVSYLRRIPDEHAYISNVLTTGDLGRLSESGTLFGNGQEHRHNFGAGGQGYGHVMFLNIQQLIQPVSIGPGIMREGTDGTPLRPQIDKARGDGATIIWCHNRFGFEDVPNWLADRLHAQNINDGGPHGSYDETYYRYLNIGLKVPFSTGTDWFIYDFSRVYVPHAGKLAIRDWLAPLEAGRTTITNGPILQLELETADGVKHAIGDTIKLDKPAKVRLRGNGAGRLDFRGVELVRNGRVVETTAAKAAGGHFEAAIEVETTIDAPGWYALRIPLEQEKNELDQPLFAHTSPIYVEFAGKRMFDRAEAETMLQEMRQALDEIPKLGKFADDTERDRVLAVYREGIKTLEARIAK